MLTFSPKGFQAANGSGNLQSINFYWDPRFHGFAGDLAVASIATAQNGSDYTYITTPKMNNFITYYPVYPAPIVEVDDCWDTPAPVLQDVPVGFYAKGIINGFSYCPLNGDGQSRVNVKNFDNTTELYPYTLVEVTLLIDPEYAFKIQTNSPYGYTSELTSNSYMRINAMELYTVEVTDTQNNTFTYSFPMGDLTDSSGGSRAYMFVKGISDSATMLAATPETVNDYTCAAEAMNLTQGITDNVSTIDDTTVYPYVYVDAVLSTPPIVYSREMMTEDAPLEEFSEEKSSDNVSLKVEAAEEIKPLKLGKFKKK